ncbi:MAG TPA: Crp/Fnr family transcriptional regulator [Candidatus Acetothermia bacterium]|nr:Crp/Fnr family transcriptional regulator [Candidatus Bipolaricaulota bacterium]HDI11209.1 Crp/Fnr family transcriptional regulator [Candidatus Acetothermia bacterium]
MPSIQVRNPLDALMPLLLRGERELYREREVIYYPGAVSDSVFFVETGHVKVSYLDSTGKRLILSLRGPGDLVGEGALMGEERRRHFVQALEDSVLVRMDRHSLSSWLQRNPDAFQGFLHWLGGRIQELERLAVDIAFRDIQARLSRKLLQLSEDFGVRGPEGVLIGFRLTHKDLSEMIGSARENTTLALNRLEQEGLLSKSRYRIVIRDEEALRRKCKLG